MLVFVEEDSCVCIQIFFFKLVENLGQEISFLLISQGFIQQKSSSMARKLPDLRSSGGGGTAAPKHQQELLISIAFKTFIFL